VEVAVSSSTMRDLVEYVAKALVDDMDAVNVT
jgi:predicted RNA-binding protein YlqC (UPF0109 family)